MERHLRIKLKNMSPLHIGKGRDIYDSASHVVSSDMLSSALASVRAMLGNHDELDRFLQSFTISSAFPYCGNEYFLPTPKGKLRIKVKGQHEYEYRKKIKKLRYISSSIWIMLMKGQSVEVDDAQLHGEFLVEVPDVDYCPPMVHVPNKRVMVPREEGLDTVPFMFEWTFFRHDEKESGLYCFIQTEDDYVDELIRLFNVLGSVGIGSDKTVGGGLFDVEVSDVERLTIEGNANLLLSTYIPEESEIAGLNLELSKFSIVKRSGFMAGSSDVGKRHLRRKTIYMFDVGSVFQTCQKLHGKVVDLSPQWDASSMHPVYRSGRPFYVTVNL